MFIPCKVSESPHPYLSHNWGPLCRIICSLKLCPREPSCLIHSSIMTAVIYYLSQLYPSFLYSAKKKKKVISVLLFLDFWFSHEQVLVPALLFQSEILFKVHWFVWLKLPQRAGINVACISYCAILRMFSTSCHVGSVHLLRANTVTCALLSHKAAPSSAQRS